MTRNQQDGYEKKIVILTAIATTEEISKYLRILTAKDLVGDQKTYFNRPVQETNI